MFDYQYLKMSFVICHFRFYPKFSVFGVIFYAEFLVYVFPFPQLVALIKTRLFA